jgi:hypothetical protein
VSARRVWIWLRTTCISTSTAWSWPSGSRSQGIASTWAARPSASVCQRASSAARVVCPRRLPWAGFAGGVTGDVGRGVLISVSFCLDTECRRPLPEKSVLARGAIFFLGSGWRPPSLGQTSNPSPTDLPSLESHIGGIGKSCGRRGALLSPRPARLSRVWEVSRPRAGSDCRAISGPFRGPLRTLEGFWEVPES